MAKRVTGLSMIQIMKAANDMGWPVEEAKHVVFTKPRKITTGSGKSGLKFIARTRRHSGRTRSLNRYEVLIIKKNDNNKKFTSNQHVIISCSCDAHKYYMEYALAAYGASFIAYSNGESPTYNNPGLIPGCCKHVYQIMENYIRAYNL